MITQEERRSIAERIDDLAAAASEVTERVRELCEASDDDAYQHGYDEGFASADDWYADRTDGELSSHGLLRLPVGADGVTVVPGQDVYGEDGRCWSVIGVGVGTYPVIAVPHGTRTDEGEYKRLKPSWLRHKRDTPSTLADEIDAIADLGGGSRAVVSDEELRSIARRLRALGGGGDE